MHRLPLAAIALTVFAASPSFAQPRFERLATAPGNSFTAGTGCSADGSIVVGWQEAPNGGGHRLSLWNEAGTCQLFSLPGDASNNSDGVAVSDDGAVVAGNSAYGPFRLTGGSLQFFMAVNGLTGRCGGMSGDGRVVVGSIAYRLANSAFRWSLTDGLQDLYFPLGSVGSVANGASFDGSIVIGNTQQSSGVRRGFRWTRETEMVSLEPLPGDAGCDASAISADGRVTVGTSYTSQNTPCVWIDGGPAHALPSPPGTMGSQPFSVSADGSVIVGIAFRPNGDQGFVFAAVWLGPNHVVHELRELLPAGTLTGWINVYPNSVSSDGTVIVGTGQDPCGRSIAWRARIDPTGDSVLSCRADFNGDGVVDPDDLSDYIGAYFSQPLSPRAEFDGMCGIGPDDLSDFIAAYFSGC